MKLRKALDEKKLDLRIQDKMLRDGKLSKEQVEESNKNLPDDEKNSKLIEVVGRGTLR